MRGDFRPSQLFPEVHITDTPTYVAPAFGNFSIEDSFKCSSLFNITSTVADYDVYGNVTFEIQASISDFQTQPPARAGNHTITFAKSNFLTSPPGGYYMCDANTTLVDVKEQKANVKLTAVNFKYKAFGKDGGGGRGFTGSVSDCSADETPADSPVPIIVGAACAAIVSAILVVYLCRRGNRQSYENIDV